MFNTPSRFSREKSFRPSRRFDSDDKPRNKERFNRGERVDFEGGKSVIRSRTRKFSDSDSGGERRERPSFGGERRERSFGSDRGERRGFGGGERRERPSFGGERRERSFGSDRGERRGFGGGERRERPSFGGERRERSFGSDRGERRGFGGGERRERPSFGGERRERPSFGGERRERPSFGGERRERPSFGGERRERPSFGGERRERPSFGGERRERPSFGGERRERPSFGGERRERPSFGGERRERPRFGGGERRERPSFGGERRERSFGSDRGERRGFGGGERRERSSFGDERGERRSFGRFGQNRFRTNEERSLFRPKMKKGPWQNSAYKVSDTSQVFTTAQEPTVDSEKVRLQKVIASTGLASRRKAEELILQGAVTVNGQVVTELGTRVDPKADSIKVNGKLLHLDLQPVFVVFYKPKGVISAMSDPEGRPCIGNVLRHVGEKLIPVGRLDYNTEGLMLLTNDGNLAERIVKARELPKVYMVKVKGHPTTDDLAFLKDGIFTQNGVIRFASYGVEQALKNKSWLKLEIVEGAGLDLRETLNHRGLLVDRIVRTAIGNITAKGLEPGEFQLIKREDFESLIPKQERTSETSALESEVESEIEVPVELEASANLDDDSSAEIISELEEAFEAELEDADLDSESDLEETSEEANHERDLQL